MTPTQAEIYANQISDAINHFGDQKKVAEILANNHPTLQQSFMRLVIYFIEEMSKKNSTDARNEASANLARMLMPYIKDKEGYYTVGLPLI